MDEKAFREELTSLLNRHGMDSLTNTPDFILSEAVFCFISTVGKLQESRDMWRGEGSRWDKSPKDVECLK